MNSISFNVLKTLISGKRFNKFKSVKYVTPVDSEKCFTSWIETSVHI